VLWSLQVLEQEVVDEALQYITFSVKEQMGGRARVSKERSKFVCDAGTWYYWEGSYGDAGA
jgi:uncharacterized protein YchJ